MENVLTEIAAILSTTADRWKQLINSIPGELLARNPGPGEWSAVECLQHMVDAEKLVFPVRIRAFLKGENFNNFNPNTQVAQNKGVRSPGELVKEFSLLRTSNLELLSTLKAADLPRTAQHSELGKVSLKELLHNWAGHDLLHLVQAERAIMQPFIKESGPWRKYYKDHDVEARTG